MQVGHGQMGQKVGESLIPLHLPFYLVDLTLLVCAYHYSGGDPPMQGSETFLPYHLSSTSPFPQNHCRQDKNNCTWSGERCQAFPYNIKKKKIKPINMAFSLVLFNHYLYIDNLNVLEVLGYT